MSSFSSSFLVFCLLSLSLGLINQCNAGISSLTPLSISFSSVDCLTPSERTSLTDSSLFFTFSFWIPDVSSFLSEPSSSEALCSQLLSTYIDDHRYPLAHERCEPRVETLATRAWRLSSFWNASLEARSNEQQQHLVSRTSEEQVESTTTSPANKPPLPPPPSYEIRLDSLGSYRPHIVAYLTSPRALASASGRRYTVLDVGGVSSTWSWGVVDVVLDFKSPEEMTSTPLPTGVRFLRGDITVDEGWKEVEEYVEANGVFDFVICAHTIEDLHNPGVTLGKIVQVSRGGQIIVPSRFVELDRAVAVGASKKMGLEEGFAGRFRGFLHHYWIFTVLNGVVTGLPKTSFIEEDFYDRVPGFTDDFALRSSFGEISLIWSGVLPSAASLPLEVFNTGFHPIQKKAGMKTNGFYSDHLAGMHAYRELLLDDDLNKISRGLHFSVNVPLGVGGGGGDKGGEIKGEEDGGQKGSAKLRLYDEAGEVAGQVTGFCDTYRIEEGDCGEVMTFVETLTYHW